MRIVHIITRLILGGAQENTLLSVEGLMKRSHRVSLVSGPAIGPEGQLVERAMSHGVDLVLLGSLRRAINPFLDLAAFIFLVRYLKQTRPDVVHTHSSKAGFLGRLAAKCASVPIIIHTIHGLPFHPYQNRFINWLYVRVEREAARWSDALVSVADAMTRQAVEAKVAPREKFVKIFSGMEVEDFLKVRDRKALRSRYDFSCQDIVVGTVGRLFHLKGHEDILRAGPKIVGKFPQVKFLFAGGGILRKRLEKLAETLGLAGRVTFTGLVEPSSIPEVLQAMDAVVHASLREGLARVLPQALLSGRPVVAYDVDGAREVIQDGKTGFLVPARDVEKLADAIIRVLSDPDTAKALATNGREICRKEFSHEIMVDRLEELYFDIARRKNLALGETRKKEARE